MPVPLRTITGKVDPIVEQMIRDLVFAVNRLEPKPDATPATVRATMPLQRAGGGAIRVNGGLLGDGSATNPLTVNIDNTSIILNASGQLEAPAAAGGITELTGPVTAGPGSGSQATTITATGVTPGTYGDATHVPQYTVGVDGRLSFAQDVAIGTTGSGGLLNVQLFDTSGSGTYTPTTGTTWVIVEGWGGCGGGSGVASAGVNQVNLGGPGGGGGYFWKKLTANFSGASYTVGAAGTGGAAGNNNGTDGGDTTFTDTVATVYTAAKGLKGTPKTSFAPPITHSGGQGGTATNGDLNIQGESGGSGQAANQFTGWAGAGGPSPLIGVTPDQTDVINATSAVGQAGTTFHAGGSGAVSSNAGGAKAGGNGAAGMIRIWEYA